jgi:hypothetical protein
MKPCTELYTVLPKYIAVILSFHSQYSIFIGTYKMATSTVSCNVCSVRHITKSSAVWCSECDEGFCTDCKEYHSLAKATRDHVTITIGEYYLALSSELIRYVMNIAKSCKNCKDLVPLEDVVDNVKNSTSFQEM